MRIRLAATLSVAAIALGAGLVALAQPPAETRDPNKSGYKPAFTNQTRAPELKSNVAPDSAARRSSGSMMRRDSPVR